MKETDETHLALRHGRTLSVKKYERDRRNTPGIETHPSMEESKQSERDTKRGKRERRRGEKRERHEEGRDGGEKSKRDTKRVNDKRGLGERDGGRNWPTWR